MPLPSTTIASQGWRTSGACILAAMMLGRGVREASKKTVTVRKPRPRMLRSQMRVTARYGTGFRGLQAAVQLRCAVLQIADTFLLSAICRAEDDSSFTLHAVTENAAAAVITRRRRRMNGAFKAIERVRCTGHGNFKRFVILISANFTRTHRLKPPIFDPHPCCHGKMSPGCDGRQAWVSPEIVQLQRISKGKRWLAPRLRHVPWG